MAKSTMSVDFLQAEFDSAMQEFLGKLVPEAVDVAIRKMAFDITSDIMKMLNGWEGLPKRIDTGRLRAAWRVGLKATGISTKGLPVTRGRVKVAEGRTSGTDGSGQFIGKGTGKPAVVVSNNVEYATFVERGTAFMRGGHHVKVALIKARRAISSDKSAGSLSSEVKKAFEGELSSLAGKATAIAAKGGTRAQASVKETIADVTETASTFGGG